MDVNIYIVVYRAFIVMAFVISTINWLGYSILAPWSKSPWGRLVWTKLFAIMLVLLVPFLQIVFNEVPFRREASLIAMGLFIIAITLVGYGIYTTQIRGYLRNKNLVHKAMQKERDG